jgi:exodeoxyribonuclease V alpha subunit
MAWIDSSKVSPMTWREVVGAAVAEGRMRFVDHYFADRMARFCTPSKADVVYLASAFVSRELGLQNTCLDLAKLSRDNPLNIAPGEYPDVGALQAAIAESEAVGTPGEDTPLILDGERLYLRRYHDYETRVAASLASMVGPSPLGRAFDVKRGLMELFPNLARGEINWQRVAAAIAMRRRLTVVTGGPGTGKTTTVTGILSLLVEHWPGDAPIIRLAAPTGKAAARLTEAIETSKTRIAEALDAPLLAKAQLAAIPDEATTLHRMLGYRALANEFRFGAQERLTADVVVVDEASMVDLRLMAQLLDALRDDARLILLGDKDQLSSVEAGMVLGDICSGLETHFESARFSPAMSAELQDVTGFDFAPLADAGTPRLADCICLLRISHRFGSDSGIGRFAEAVNTGRPVEVEKVLGEGLPDIAWHRESDGLGAAIGDLAHDGYRSYLELIGAHEKPESILDRFGRFRVLAAVRNGTDGVAGLNRTIETALANAGWIQPDREHYEGRPVLVSENDYQLELFNGDVGIELRDPQTGDLVVYFPSPEGGVKIVRPSRLPAHETVYAMTIHKSQGSEFDRLAVVLPMEPTENELRVLTRELVYTAVTRARGHVELFAVADVLYRAIAQRAERSSGLAERLWGT